MAEKIKFDSLQPEFFSNEQTWAEFMEALADVIQEQIRDPIGEIEDIRHIVETTDPMIVSNTIKQMGFDIPADLIEHNAERLSKSVYMLALIHEVSGTKDFVKGVRFVLGRDVQVHNLYTNNYVDFYDQPKGPMIAEGGDWYATTHINLGMELLPSDANLILPVGKTMADRLMDAYFEFAPINHVVRDFYFKIPAKSTLGMAGKVVVDPIDFIEIGMGAETPVDITPNLPSEVTGGDETDASADVRFESDLCFVLAAPVYGYGDSNIDSDLEIEQQLTMSAPNTNSFNMEIDVPAGKYAYVAYPVELGRATFTDAESNIQGGWDGATWPEDGSIGDTLGPKVLTRIISGEERDWYVYRTDFTGIGNKTFVVELEFSGRKSSCDPTPTDPIDPPPLDPVDPTDPTDPVDPVDPPDGCTVTEIPLLPVFGEYESGIDSGAEIEFLQSEAPSTNNQTLSVPASSSKYGYIAYPTELGLATIIDVETGLEGGWDGASWPEDGSIGDTFGPIVVSRSIGDSPSDWYVYRTDFSGVGTREYQISFENAGETVTVTKTECEQQETVSGYPTAVVGPIGIDTDSELNSQNALVMPDTENTSLTIELDPDEYGYFAHPVELGVATFTDRSTGISGGWDGAGWPSDGSVGSVYGPIIIQRDIGGQLYDWYLYRTDFHTMSEKVFDITFENPGIPVDDTIATPPGGTIDDGDDEVPTGLFVSGYPKYGSDDVVQDSNQIDSLSDALTSTDNQRVTLNAGPGSFAFFAYPKALGEATFVNPDLGISGGMDGASWPSDGTIGDTYGPIEVEKDGTVWYVYRSDFSGIGEIVFDVSFENPGQEVVGPAPEPTVASFSMMSLQSNTCRVSGRPKFGTGNLVSDQSAIEALEFTSVETDNHVFSMNVPEGEYGWFAHPAALGEARFVDTQTTIEGGWDGATWPEGSVEFSEGPVVVQMNHDGELVDWLLYRTDFSGLGDISFTVLFPNHGLEVGDTVMCDTSGYPDPVTVNDNVDTTHVNPVYGTGPAGITTNPQVNANLMSEFVGLNDTQFSLTVPVGEYGYFAHPAYLGVARFEDIADGSSGGWDGAGWPSDGSVGTTQGPLAFYRKVDGKLQAWYLYRTDFPGLGSKTYQVRFGNAPASSIDGSRVVRIVTPEYSTDRPDLVRFTDTGKIMFMPVFMDTVVNITMTYGGVSTTSQVTIRAQGAQLEYITLNAPNIVSGGDIFTVTVDGHYRDGHIRPIDNADIRVLSPYVLRKQGYMLDTGNPSEDVVLYLQASYTDRAGITHRKTEQVILKSVILETTIDQLDIIGPDSMIERESQQYRAHAYFSDGTNREVLCLWESSSPALYVDQSGLATAGSPEDTMKATLKITYQHRGIKYTANKDVELMLNYITPVSMEIRGPERVVELSDYSYSAFITWSNGAVTKANPEWNTDRFSIDSDGRLTAGSVGGSTSVTIRARSRNLVATKVIAVYDTPIEVEHISIFGPENLKEGIVGKYRAYAKFNDGTTIEIKPDWSIVNNPGFITINEDGQMEFNNPSVGIVEIKAEYDNGLRVHSQTKSIVLVPNVSIISGLSISGDSEVLEGDRLHLTATAVYEDGSTQTVAPIWGVRSPDPLNDPEPPADIVSPGIVQGRFVDENTVVIVTARYFKEIAEYPIIVKNYEQPGPDVPVSYRIDGPRMIRASEYGSYSLLCKFDNGCDQEIALSNDWSLDVGSDVAIIDAHGFLRSVNGESVDVTVIAEWEFAGHTIRDELLVHIVAEESTLGALLIKGPSAVDEKSITNYDVELFRAGQPVVPDTGEIPDPIETEWLLDTQMARVVVTDNGELYVGDVATGSSVVLRVRVTEGFHTIEATKVVTIGESGPQFGPGPIGLDDFADLEQYAGISFDPATDTELTVTLGTGEYLYFAYPASYGEARFVESSTGLEGGMDGATWPDDGSIGSTTGPLTITRVSGGVPTDWYLYRSDFSGLGTITYEIYFDQD